MLVNDSAFGVTKGVLSLINDKLIDHGIRTAYILKSMLTLYGGLDRETMKKVLFLSIFHDVGANKTEEIANLLKFETTETVSHSVYGYLFLKYLSSLGAYAEVILYHHMPYEERLSCKSEYVDLALKLHLADRVDICALHGGSDRQVIEAVESAAGQFDPAAVELFKAADKKFGIMKNIRGGGYEEDIKGCYRELAFSEDELMDLVQTLVFSIDFRSEQTVLHTIQTANYAAMLGETMGLCGDDCRKLYYAGLLHDIGKIKVPVAILEKPGRLTREEMGVMREHALYTRMIITGHVDKEVLEIAARHHEKLDGSGYPEGLRGEALTLPQRIMAVADITSALFSRRSYREKMPKEEVLEIIGGMARDGYLDAAVVTAMCGGYDGIIGASAAKSCEAVNRYEALKREYALCVEKYGKGPKRIYGDSELFFMI